MKDSTWKSIAPPGMESYNRRKRVLVLIVLTALGILALTLLFTAGAVLLKP